MSNDIIHLETMLENAEGRISQFEADLKHFLDAPDGKKYVKDYEILIEKQRKKIQTLRDRLMEAKIYQETFGS